MAKDYQIQLNVDESKTVSALRRIREKLQGVKLLAELWVWDEEDRVYRNDETGETLNEIDLVLTRNGIANNSADFYTRALEEDEEEPDEDSNLIVVLLLLGVLALGEWERRMRAAIQRAWTIQYVIGRGGEEQMTDADWERLEGILVEQYGFLSGFSEDIAAGRMTEAQIHQRAAWYFSASVAAYEIARQIAFHNRLALSRNPGDCTSECCANDRCYWNIVDNDATISCRWIRTAAESCATCISRAGCPEVVFVKSSGEHINMECYE